MLNINDVIKVGVVGLGWVGNAYAEVLSSNNLVNLVKYDLKKEPHTENRLLIKECEVVLIAVPTPTIQNKVDYSALEDALSIAGAGSLIVIKSSLLPGSSRRLQEENKHLTIVHMPEFLRKKQHCKML